MYGVFLAIQYVGILILAIEIFYILQQRSSHLQNLLLIVVFATLVNFVGYLFEIRSTSKEQALLAVKMIYLGKPYIVLGTFLFIMQFYRIKLSKALTVFLCVFHVSISVLVFSCKYHQLYYNSIDYVYEGYFPHLVLGHGIMYQVFTGFIAAYLVMLFYFGFRKYRTSRLRQEKKQILFLMVITAVAGGGLLLYLTGWMKGYDTTLPAYMVSNLLLLYALVRYNLLDTLSIAKENVIDKFADGLFVLDRNEHILFTNPQVRELYPSLDDMEESEILNELEQYSKSGERLHKKDKVYQITKKSIKENNNFYGSMYIVQDVTENYKYMIRLEKQTAYAKKANKAKSDFLAKMSHEIRTPINSVLGMDEMILRESEEENIRRYAVDIKTAAQSLLSIINEILDSSKIESGKLKIIPVEYEFDSLLNDVINMIVFKVREKKLEFKIHIQEDLPNRLVGDDIRVRQILVNLLTNAVKYTREGSVSFDVTGNVEENEVILHVVVQDTGIGIKEEDLPQIGTSYKRMEESRNRGVEGTGLGMSIVIDLLQMMGSKLQIDSVYGEGSTFSFELRQGIASHDPIGDYTQRSRILGREYRYEVSFQAPDAKILLIDDNDINRRVFQNLLKETGMRITDVASGEEGLELIAEEHFDLIFLDHMMPGLDGIQTLCRMRKMEKNCCKDTPVIVLTANAVVGAREKYLKKGFDNFLTKPIDPDKLELIIRSSLPEGLIREVQREVPLLAGGDMPEEELPELEEFDWTYARLHLQDTEILKHTIRDIYDSLDDEYTELDRLYEQIRDEKKRSEYRTRVHALKSNMAMVGALLLSKIARMLEVAALEGNIEKIDRLHPILLEEIKNHKERMAVFAGERTKEERLARLLEGEI